LFIFKARRLSVDIDLNYIGAADREVMLSERPKIEQAVQAVCGRLGMQVRRAPTEHAGGKWRLSYPNAWGRPGTLELDINFLSIKLGSSCSRVGKNSLKNHLRPTEIWFF
jgi:hypothetical protein